ncbi:uncharacterized protein VP01_1652g1, partial [Puccinia sorghi]
RYNTIMQAFGYSGVSLGLTAVPTPRVLYGALVWFQRNQKTVTNILDLINKSAARFCLGAVKSTPTIQAIGENSTKSDKHLTSKKNLLLLSLSCNKGNKSKLN